MITEQMIKEQVDTFQLLDPILTDRHYDYHVIEKRISEICNSLYIHYDDLEFPLRAYMYNYTVYRGMGN
jgi:hypothetical protein